jgi:hypothetical protein
MYGDVDWIKLAREGVQLWFVVNTITELRVP